MGNVLLHAGLLGSGAHWSPVRGRVVDHEHPFAPVRNRFAHLRDAYGFPLRRSLRDRRDGRHARSSIASGGAGRRNAGTTWVYLCERNRLAHGTAGRVGSALDYVFYGAFPGVVYLWLIAAAAGLWSDSLFGLYGLAVGTLALLLIGIRDAWDLAVWLIYHRDP